MRGHITKRSKDSWTIVLSLGRDPATGKRRQQWVTVKGTKRDAERKLAELLHQAETGTLPRPSKLTVGQFFDQWLQTYAADNPRVMTVEGYRTNLNRLRPYLGNIALSQLTTLQVKSAYATLLDSPRRKGRPGKLSPRTVLYSRRVLYQALEDAVEWGLLARNPAASKTIRIQVDDPEHNAMDDEALARFLQACEGTLYHALFYLDAHTGLRRGELLGLRWMDVDLLAGEVTVRQTLKRLRGEWIVEPPKTKKGRRTFDLTPEAVLVLKLHRERVEAERVALGAPPPRPEDLVFSKPDGSPLVPNTVSEAFRRFAVKAGLRQLVVPGDRTHRHLLTPGVRLHDLRHTHATLLLDEGVPLHVVQERMGHALPSITANIYGHALPNSQKEAARRLSERFQRRGLVSNLLANAGAPSPEPVESYLGDSTSQ